LAADMLLCSRKGKLEFHEFKYTEINIINLYHGKYGNVVKSLFEEKSRLDFLFNNGLAEIYANARNALYPDIKVNDVFCNRAASKLDEIMIKYNIEYTNFLDICAGPGSMSDYLLRKNENSTGIGITIESDEESKNFYTHLKRHSRYICIEHDILNENGDILKLLNGKKIDFCIADGAPSENDYKDENLQECAAFDILNSEMIYILHVLAEGGNLVIKLFDIFHEYSRSLIYLLTKMFKFVYLTKPTHSRVVNSEKYIICLYYDILEHDKIRIIGQLLSYKTKTNMIPSALINVPTDSKFTAAIDKFIHDKSREQTVALKHVIDRCYDYISGIAIDEEATKGKGKGKSSKNKGKGKGKRTNCKNNKIKKNNARQNVPNEKNMNEELLKKQEDNEESLFPDSDDNILPHDIPVDNDDSDLFPDSD